MGRRVGLGHLETLMENLKRDIAFGKDSVQSGARRKVTSITDSTYSVTEAQSGTIFTLNRAAGIVVTLPAAVAGLEYEFYVETALTSNNYTVNAASSGDALTGLLV